MALHLGLLAYQRKVAPVQRYCRLLITGPCGPEGGSDMQGPFGLGRERGNRNKALRTAQILPNDPEQPGESFSSRSVELPTTLCPFAGGDTSLCSCFQSHCSSSWS